MDTLPIYNCQGLDLVDTDTKFVGYPGVMEGLFK